MPLVIPESLKVITQYIRRAEELDKDPSTTEYRVVSYYCKKYALEQAVKLKVNSPEATGFITQVLTLLEKEKPKLGISVDQAPVIVETFAFSVFSRADDEDRKGLATKATAKLFYSAASFYDVLEQFGELEPEALEKRKYCKWKAADILKAINEGRKPTPGGFGESTDEGGETYGMEDIKVNAPISLPSAPKMSVNSDLTIPTAPTQPPMHFQSFPSAPAPTYTSPSANPSAPTLQPTPPPQYQPPVRNRPPANHQTDPRVQDAIEFSAFAIAALKQNDVNLAKDRLQEALRRLNSS